MLKLHNLQDKYNTFDRVFWGWRNV